MEAAREDGVDEIRASGGLVVRDGRVVVVHRPEYDDWSLPEGEGGSGRERRGLCAARDRGGDRPALRARRGAVDDAAPGHEREAEARALVADAARLGGVRADRRGRRPPLADARRGAGAAHVLSATSSCSTKRSSTTCSRAASGRAASRNAAPSRMPPRDGVNGTSSRRETSARISAPARRRARPLGTDAELGRALGGGAAGEDLDDVLELVRAVLVPDDPRDGACRFPRWRARSRAAAARRRRTRHGRTAAPPRSPPRVRRVAREQGGGQAQRAEVDRPHPGRAEQLGADDHLGRAAADVADRDDSFAGVRARDRAREGEPALLLGRDDADVRRGCAADRVEQALRLVALPSRRGDDRLQLADAELPRDARVLARHGRDLVQLRSPDAPVAQDLLAEAEVRSFLAERARRVADDRRDEQPDRVRPHVDDPHAHAGHSGKHPGQTPELHRSRLRDPTARRERSRARRCRFS